MLYQTVGDLPDCVRNDLPQRAQAHYLKAFNCAWEQYSEVSSGLGDETREATAHHVAWSALTNIYEKDEQGGTWILRREVQLT